MTIDRPVPFPGTPEEARANLATHDFVEVGGANFLDSECLDCCCKPWHMTARYPCGQDPPRENWTPPADYDHFKEVRRLMGEALLLMDLAVEKARDRRFGGTH